MSINALILKKKQHKNQLFIYLAMKKINLLVHLFHVSYKDNRNIVLHLRKMQHTKLFNLKRSIIYFRHRKFL